MQKVESKQLKKRIIYIIIFIVGGILLSHSNNNPQRFIERIIPSIEYKEGGVINASAIIVLIAVWVSGAKLIEELQWDILKKARKFFHPLIREVIILALLGVVIQNANELGIKVYKSFQKDLNAIYLNREESNIRIGWETYYIDEESSEAVEENREGIIESYKEAGKEIVVHAQPDGYMNVKNCSRHTVGPFKVRLMIKEDFKASGMEEEAPKEYTYELPEKYIIGAGQEETIRFHNSKFEEKSLELRGKGHTGIVNVVLISDNETCVFENQYY